MESIKPNKIEQPKYKDDPTYLGMMFLVKDRKNLRSIQATLEIAREQPEAFSDSFFSKLDILGQVLDGNIKEEELGKRNYPPKLVDFAESLVEEFASIAFK